MDAEDLNNIADEDEIENLAEDEDEVGDEAGDEAGEETGDVAGDDTVDEAGEETGDAAGDEDSADLSVPAYKGSFPASLLAALVGALLGPIPALLGVFISHRVFYPLFIAAPLFIYLFGLLFKSRRDISTLIIAVVFSLVSAYLTVLSCQAALYVIAYSKPLSGILLLIIITFGELRILPSSLSANVYPLIFTALGVVATWQLVLAKKPAKAECGILYAEFEDDAPADDEILEPEDNPEEKPEDNQEEKPEDSD